MIKELYQTRYKEISLNITNGEIDSVRKKNTVRTGCRVYDNGCIGVAGVLGEPTEETWRAAEEALSQKVPYPYAVSGATQRVRMSGALPDQNEFIRSVEYVLSTLKAEFPGYILSNKISAVEAAVRMENDLGLKLYDSKCVYEVGIVVKDEASANVFDTFIFYVGELFDTEKILAIGREVLTAHSNPVPMPKENLPVIMDADIIIGPFADAVNGMNLHKGASLFSGKIGEKLFADHFGLECSRREDTYNDFFDAEGTVLKGDAVSLFENGVLIRGTADKLCAAEFGAELTASAVGAYDDVPVLGGAGTLRFVPNGSLDELLCGRDAIAVISASGGDTTPAGDFATPVQTAYIYRDGKLVARLPEFNFGGNLFRMFGEDYIGCAKEKFFSGSAQTLVLKGDIR